MKAEITGQVMQNRVFQGKRGEFRRVNIVERNKEGDGTNEYSFMAKVDAPGVASLPVLSTVKLSVEISGYMKGYNQNLSLVSVTVEKQ